MAKLCVNVDHVATVRQARMIDYPDPLEAALLAEAAGASGVTIHLREDRRHIQDSDVSRIRKKIATKLNLEMAAAPEIITIALKTKPWQVTFVPERRQEVTTEGGLNLARGKRKLGPVLEKFRGRKILTSLFIDPDEESVRIASGLGADAVEFNTGAYCETKSKKSRAAELKKIEKMCAFSSGLGLVTHAGHGLHLGNVRPIAAISVVDELNIGHSIVSRALMVGFVEAVREMIEALEEAARG